MYKSILNEELGIANEVNDLVIRIKNLISNDYGRNNNNTQKYLLLDKTNTKYIVYHNTIITNIDNKNIIVEYYILNNKEETIINQFLKDYISEVFNGLYKLNLYLTCNSKNNKIDWLKHSGTLQHEIEHLYQFHKKGKNILTDKQISLYKKYNRLMHSDDLYEKIIGFTYYYYCKREKDAFTNTLYRNIIDSFMPGHKIDIMSIIKKSHVYHNIQIIKNCINDEKNLLQLNERLLKHNKTLEKYLKDANIVINEYTKIFGRLLYKANKDIKKLEMEWIPENFNKIFEDYDEES